MKLIIAVMLLISTQNIYSQCNKKIACEYSPILLMESDTIVYDSLAIWDEMVPYKVSMVITQTIKDHVVMVHFPELGLSMLIEKDYFCEEWIPSGISIDHIIINTDYYDMKKVDEVPLDIYIQFEERSTISFNKNGLTLNTGPHGHDFIFLK